MYVIIDILYPTNSHVNVNFTGDDFTLDAIELAYGDILGSEIVGYEKPRVPANSPRTIKEEDNLDSFWERCKRLKFSISPGRQNIQALFQSFITRLHLVGAQFPLSLLIICLNCFLILLARLEC